MVDKKKAAGIFFFLKCIYQAFPAKMYVNNNSDHIYSLYMQRYNRTWEMEAYKFVLNQTESLIAG